LRIAIYAIALNEIAHVPRFLAACADADAIVAADTGSTDGTREALRDGAAITHSITIRPWRFDDARNVALALVPADIDVCFAIDLDEMPGPGWRAALERAWTPETTLGRYRHVASHLPNGAPAVEMSGARIHRRFGYRWPRAVPATWSCWKRRSPRRRTSHAISSCSAATRFSPNDGMTGRPR
jgi:glycosyltransferase involved in cell wall biosynthesis